MCSFRDVQFRLDAVIPVAGLPHIGFLRDATVPLFGLWGRKDTFVTAPETQQCQMHDGYDIILY